MDLWYGEADTLVALEMGRHLERTIPASRLTVVPGAGHTLYLPHWPQILRSVTGAPG